MRTEWWSRRAITLHVALVVALPVFFTLGAWQLQRALRGNLLSWAYTFEWPFFALYATWMWWRLVHEEAAQAVLPARAGDVRAAATTGCGPVPAAYDPFDDEADPELAAYNRYLAGLHAEHPER